MLETYLYKFLESHQALEYIVDHITLDRTKTYWITKLMEKCQVEQQIFIKQNNRLTRIYGEEIKDRPGQFKVKNDLDDTYQNEVTKLLNTIIPISKMNKIDIEWFGKDAEIPANIRSKLLWLIAEPKGSEEFDVIESVVPEFTNTSVLPEKIDTQKGSKHKCK